MAISSHPIASDDVEHGEDEEPHAAGDENGIEHGTSPGGDPPLLVARNAPMPV
jgi:hypothetical protein